MKTMKSNGIIAALMMLTMYITAQPVAPSDMIAAINSMPQLPQSLTDAYQISYAKNATFANAKAMYTEWLKTVETPIQQGIELIKKFYLKNPTGLVPTAQPTPSKASPAQNAAMQSAIADLSHKMLNDPDFAKKFQAMSEAEQHAYMAKLLESKGLAPAQGVANSPSQQPAGLDIAWAEICTVAMQSAQDMSWINEQNELQIRHDAWHEEVNKWATKEIEKLPLITFGEYGKDHDPEKVKAIQQKARHLHKEIAAVALKDYQPVLMKNRQKLVRQFESLNTELKNVQYGKSYDFGIHYPLVLQTQLAALQTIAGLVNNETAIIEACAKWEHEQRVNQ
jgi:hypothetical protein